MVWYSHLFKNFPQFVVCRTRSSSKNRTCNNGLVQNGKGTRPSMLSPCLFNLYVGYILQNARLDDSQAGIKITERNINSLKYADDTSLMAESEED